MNDELDSLDLEVNDKSTVISVGVRKQLKTFGGWSRGLGFVFIIGGFLCIYSLVFVTYEALRSSYNNDAEYVFIGLLMSAIATICLLIGFNLNRFGKKLRKIADFTDENFSKALKNGSNAMGIATIVVGIAAGIFLFIMIMGTYFTIERINRNW